MNELKYSIGDYVIAPGKMFRQVSGSKIGWVYVTFSKPRFGQIVGLVVRYDGHVEGAWKDPNYFVPLRTHTFWQVKFGLMNKPVCVAEEYLRFATINEVQKLPKLFQRDTPWSERSRKSLSLDSKNWPRDKKGRWL